MMNDLPRDMKKTEKGNLKRIFEYENLTCDDELQKMAENIEEKEACGSIYDDKEGSRQSKGNDKEGFISLNILEDPRKEDMDVSLSRELEEYMKDATELYVENKTTESKKHPYGISQEEQEGTYFEGEMKEANGPMPRDDIRKLLRKMDEKIDAYLETEKGDIVKLDKSPINISIQYNNLSEERLEQLKEINRKNYHEDFKKFEAIKQAKNYQNQSKEELEREFIKKFIMFDERGVVVPDTKAFSRYLTNVSDEDIEEESILSIF